ncbi:related to glycosyl hydrolase, family 15 [Serendipita indica DSM 11827]|uniref:Related to glycosyl hydrolase, family 15 n=1 Tax=Serendipita indica (strain DSM 11827) TaxID=1109443 RepID=G4TZC3_SERID|nr:related to glycosyl hydrolase, family 15 [Serendipita indica DSM 11827]
MHVALIKPNIPNEAQQKVLFTSENLKLDLRYVADSTLDDVPVPEINFEILYLPEKGHLGPGAHVDLKLKEGQVVTFFLRTPPKEPPVPHAIPKFETAKEFNVTFESIVEGANKLRARDDPILTKRLADGLLKDTNEYWQQWIGRSTYEGNWREAVHRSALALKLLIFEPTGKCDRCLSDIFTTGIHRWDKELVDTFYSYFLTHVVIRDYRYCWIRDSSFTLYALIRLGFTDEANAFMDFIFKRVQERNPDGSLQIMYSIHGEKKLPEIELHHLDGHKGSRPVRYAISSAHRARLRNAVLVTELRIIFSLTYMVRTPSKFGQLQLTISLGELLDFIYLSQKFARPLGYDLWLAVRDLVDYVIANCHRPDLSIWEVRSKQRHFTYSKIMMW